MAPRIGEYAPILVADAKGYFTDEGIAHRIADGGPGKNPIPIVAVGQAQFGMVTSGLYPISARTARDPVDAVAKYPGQIEDAKKLAWRSKGPSWND